MRTYVHNPAAYEAAIQRNIQANATKTRFTNWKKQGRNFEVFQYLFNNGWKNDFLSSLKNQLDEWGQLTPKQCEMVLRTIDGSDERKAKYDKELAEKKAKSNYVGEVKDRKDWTLVLEFTTSWDTQFGTNYLYILKDIEGNTFKYVGGSFPVLKKGETIKFKATIKEHVEYKGEKQTVLARPKVEFHTCNFEQAVIYADWTTVPFPYVETRDMN